MAAEAVAIEEAIRIYLDKAPDPSGAAVDLVGFVAAQLTVRMSGRDCAQILYAIADQAVAKGDGRG